MSPNRMLPVASLVLLMAPWSLLAEPLAAQAILVDSSDKFRQRLPRPWISVDNPPRESRASYRLESLSVDASLDGSVAQVATTQTFRNTGNTTIEATFLFPLPYDGAIDQLTLLVDGKELAGRLLTKEEARSRYEEIVRKSRDPALLEWVGVGMYQTSVFPIPAGDKREVTLRYTQVCRKTGGLTDFLFPLRTARFSAEPVKELRVRVAISSRTELKNIYSPSHEIDIDRTDARHAVVMHRQSDVLTTDDFRLFYDAASDDVGASVIAYRPAGDEDGYFLLLASPKMPADQQPTPKTVVFTIDRSGSMTGAKIDQAREAAKFVLNHLREGDLFNVIAYDDEVESFRPELQRLDASSRSAALGFINGLHAGGGTNINDAIVQTLQQCQDPKRPTYIVFLTDGLPTTGTTTEGQIVENAKQANDAGARLFPLGLGYDVNSRLLDKLARSNHGQTEYVRPSENIEDRVSRLYQRIESPVLTGVQIAFERPGATEADGPALNRVYPGGPFDLFAGDQTVVVGRYARGGSGQLRLTGNLRGDATSYAFEVELPMESRDQSHSFVGRLWATRRVGEIIDQIDLQGKNDELVTELVELAKQHGILTPYTSFLAEEEGALRNEVESAARVGRATEGLAELDTRFGFRQRFAKGQYQAAAAPTPATYSLGDVAGQAGGGGGYAAPAAMLDPLARTQGRGLSYYDANNDRRQIAAAIMQAGNKTFVRSGEQWVDASVSDDELRHATQLERYSPRYFALLERHGDHVGAYLALEGSVCVKLDNVVYQW